MVKTTTIANSEAIAYLACKGRYPSSGIVAFTILTCTRQKEKNEEKVWCYKKKLYLCIRFGDVRVFHPGMKRESGGNPEQYPLLSSPLSGSPYQPLSKIGKADFRGRARKPANRYIDA